MPDSNTKRLINQAENKAFVEIVDEHGISSIVEVLQDEKYPWRERKMKNLKLADIYAAAGPEYESYVSRAKTCASSLRYNAMHDGRRTLQQGIFCQLRLCPLCGTRKAKKAALQLSRALTWVEQQHQGVHFIFLTLTVKNCPGADLSATMDLLLSGWSKLRRHRPVERAVKGWYRAVEITRRGNMYHPHIHAIIAVEDGYFKRSNGVYLTQKDWESHWQSALGVSYRPRVDVRATRSRNGKRAVLASALEAAKYATKDSDYIAPNIPMAEAIEVVKTYTRALRGRRLIAFGGWLSDAMKALRLDPEDNDLVHIDEDAIRDDVAELIEIYGWHFGFGDYLLLHRAEKQRETQTATE